MNRFNFVWVVLTGVALFVACNKAGRPDDDKSMVAENRILQGKDGTISLRIDKAECYQDMVNPATNTAEWNVVVSKSGRFDVWLTSATKDTTDLDYKNSVRLSIRDNRLETVPTVSRVVQNSSDVSLPYYRADSFMGSLYIQDTGTYNIQVISDKVLPADEVVDSGMDVDTKILAVSLTPVRRQ